MDSFKLVRCELQHVPFLTEFGRETFIKAFAHHNTPEDMAIYLGRAFTIEQMEKEIRDPKSPCYLLEYEGDYIGYFKLNLCNPLSYFPDPLACEIERVYVDSSRLNLGIGSRLLKEAIDLAKAQGGSYVWLGVWEKNDGAIRFYQRHGFERVGEHPFMLGNDLQTDWEMRLVF